MSGDWGELRDDFFLLILPHRTNRLPTDGHPVFEQLGASSSDLSIPDDVSLNVSYLGLDMKIALDLDVAAGGWFAHTNPMEGRAILNSFLENSFFPTDQSEPRQKKSTSILESLSTPESEFSSFTSLYSSIEPSPELRAPKEEEIQPSEFSS